ncbi:hypothetical protein LIER_11669 [Lithospermum erythrorhizon]|uniref:C3H1-type domain-containing protein n=1 Tax=Lithospermum erythrorhizon TaxID=34254 RepID=A0AAV3PRV1_LITER
MGDSGRRRGSMRDVIDEDLPPTTDRGRYREYSTLPHNSTLRPRDHSRWSSLEEKGDRIVNDNIIAETRDRLYDSSYYRSMSPGFDGLEQQKWSNAPDKKWSQSRRYGERRRSRSRGLEKSRSRSPFCSRGTKRARDWSRSRSTSRSKGSIRGHSRSHSPRYDQGPESHRWSDRKSSRGRSSQACKDFEAGMCRKGSQCRFIHSDNEPRDDEPLDSDIDGRWKCKQELGHGSKYNYDKAADEFSDAYHGENGPSRIRPRGSVTCRDFVKGSRRYGESCRFSHSTENDHVDRSFRNAPVDTDHGHNLTEARRSLCKFFLSGNCRRDNCRFSHDTSLSNEHEDGIHDKVGGRIVGMLGDWKGPRHEDRIHDKVGGRMVGTLDDRKGPWDDPEKPATTRTTSKWGASVDADMDLSEDVSVGRRGDERWGYSLDDEMKDWERNNSSLNRVHYHSHNRTNDENGRCDSAKAMVIENSFGEQQIPTYQEYRSRSLDKRAPHIQNHNLRLEAAQDYLSSPSANPQVFMNSGTHQYQGIAEYNRGPVLESGALYEPKDCRNSNGQSVNPEIRSAFGDNSSVLGMKGQQILSPISNAWKVNLNEPTHVVFPSNVNERINWKQSTIQHMPEPSSYSYFPVRAPNEQFAPLSTSSITESSVNNTHAVHVAKIFLDEIKTQLHTVLDPSTLMATASSQMLLHPVPADCPQNISNPTRSIDQHPLLKNDSGNAANDQKARELLSSLSVINLQLSTLHQNGDPKVEVNDDSKENQHEATKELEVNDNGEKSNMSKIEADNNDSNRADDQGKEEGGNNIKDEKVIRLFKIALVELVKDILKPKWKEGKMSREVHKTVVKKAVDKVTITIQAEHVPKTQEKIEQYLSSNRLKISKLVQAYMERSLKAGS